LTDRGSVVEQVARIAGERDLRVVTAESLTAGAIAQALASGSEAATWFGGGVVAYMDPVKFDVLKVDEGPVVSARCAEQMARGACRLLSADVAVASTGVGGPGPREGLAPGTVFVSIATGDGFVTRKLQLQGAPEEVLAQTRDYALELLVGVLGDS